MKKIIFLLALVFGATMYSMATDTLTIITKIKEVTVFNQGAYVGREAKVVVAQGKHVLIVEGLPAELNPESIQVDNNNKGKILSVKHDVVYPSLNKEMKKQYDQKVKAYTNQIKELQNQISVYEMEERLLVTNSDFNNKKSGTTIAEIREAAAFYRTKLNEIKQAKLGLSFEVELLRERIRTVSLEFNQYIAQNNKVHSKLYLTIDAKVAINTKFLISYYVTSAGWTPDYDFRVKDIDQPLNIVYNANIFQQTGEDWTNVKLKLSTHLPSLGSHKPTLNTWYVENNRSYYNKPAQQNAVKSGSLRGMVMDDKTGEPLPFANVVVKQNSQMIAGATTDFDGNYSIQPLNSGYYDIVVSYVGYSSKAINNVYVNASQPTRLNIQLATSDMVLEDAVVVEYSSPLIDNQDRPRSVRKRKNKSEMDGKIQTIQGVQSKEGKIASVSGYSSAPTVAGLEYAIDVPYSVMSDGKEYSVEIKEMRVPVNYVYYAVPKLDKDVFLVAEIANWNQLDLLSGTVDIYYNGVFTGTTFIDANNTSDTLDVSLNRDRSILVERTSVNEKNEKHLGGKTVKETISWNITIKNNKNKTVRIVLEDQLPVSQNAAIEIDVHKLSGAKKNDQTGLLIWDFELIPNEKKELYFEYQVKYPESISF